MEFTKIGETEYDEPFIYARFDAGNDWIVRVKLQEDVSPSDYYIVTANKSRNEDFYVEEFILNYFDEGTEYHFDCPMFFEGNIESPSEFREIVAWLNELSDINEALIEDFIPRLVDDALDI